MLTLAFAQIVWSIAFQWDAVTGGCNGLVGIWPPALLADRAHYYLFTLVLVAVATLALVRIAHSPFGFALRGVRDSSLRAAAVGIDVRGTQWRAFALAGAFAGLAGGLYAILERQHLAGDARDPAIGRCARHGAARRTQRDRSAR